MAVTTTAREPEITPQLPPNDPTSLLPKKLVRARPLFDPGWTPRTLLKRGAKNFLVRGEARP